MNQEPAPAPALPVRTMLFAAALLWGLNMPVIKWLTGYFDPVLLSALRMLAACVSLALLLRRRSAWPDLDPGQLRQLLLCGVLMVYLNQLLVQSLVARMDALVIAVAIDLVGSVCLLLHAATEMLWSGRVPKAAGSPVVWLVVLLSGALSTGMGNLLWNRALGSIGMARASVWLYWVPIFGIGAAVLFLGEPLTGWLLVGLVLVLGGTRLGSQRVA